MQVIPEECFNRLSKRGRSEESTVSLEYLTQIHNLHEKWLLNEPNVSVLNGHHNEDELLKETIEILERVCEVTLKDNSLEGI